MKHQREIRHKIGVLDQDPILTNKLVYERLKRSFDLWRISVRNDVKVQVACKSKSTNVELHQWKSSFTVTEMPISNHFLDHWLAIRVCTSPY